QILGTHVVDDLIAVMDQDAWLLASKASLIKPLVHRLLCGPQGGGNHDVVLEPLALVYRYDLNGLFVCLEAELRHLGVAIHSHFSSTQPLYQLRGTAIVSALLLVQELQNVSYVRHSALPVDEGEESRGHR